MCVPVIEMVEVPEGTFWMGNCEARYKEQPIHEVYISKFMIGKFPVTQEQWECVTGRNSAFEDIANSPMEFISWDHSQYWIKYLNSITGLKYRFPTEAEWEYACKGAGKDPFYGVYDLDEVAWHNGNSDGSKHPVGLKKPNILGIHDMLGNVWEWCQDYYKSDYYKISPYKNPKCTKRSVERILRGGSWIDSPNFCESSDRNLHYYKEFNPRIGFRLARTIK